MKQSITKFIIILLLLGSLIEAGMLCFVIYQEGKAKPEKSDLLLVLGAQLWGEYPSPFLQARLEKAIELYRAGYAGVILVSGGQGTDEPISEALSMKNYLVDHGIPPEAVLMEDQSTSTRENIAYSKAIMDRHGYASAIIVTNDFHVYRGVLDARNAKIDASGAAAPTEPAGSKWYFRVRETLALLYYWVFG